MHGMLCRVINKKEEFLGLVFNSAFSALDSLDKHRVVDVLMRPRR